MHSKHDKAKADSVLGSQGRQRGATEPAQGDAGQAQLAKAQDDTEHGTQGLAVLFDYDDTAKWEQRRGHGSRRLPGCLESTNDSRTQV